MTAQDRSSTDLAGDSTVQDRSVFVPVAEAARRLGVSTATVKRRIRDGSLEAEPLSRPQGIEYRVRLPRDVTPTLVAPDSDVTAALSHGSAPPTARSDSEPVPRNDGPHVTSRDLSAAITAAAAPLTERLAVQDATIARQAETIQRQAGEIADLREERGRHAAELERAASTIVALGEENAKLRTAQVAASPGLMASGAVTDASVPLAARQWTLAPWVLAVLAIVAVVWLLIPR